MGRMNRRLALKRMLGGAALAAPETLGKFPSLFSLDEIGQGERSAMAAVAEDFRRRFDAPGLSVAIAQDGRVIYQQAFGTTGHDSQEPLTTSHLFRIASVSKPITSSAVFTLMEKGRLRSGDTVFGASGVLGTTYGEQSYARGIEQITVDHLLTHTAGGWDNGLGDPMFSHPSMSQAELISWTLDHKPLQNPPGTVFAYSNFGYCLLGRVIEKISGQPYREFVQKAILNPCGITDMRIGGNTLQDRAPREVTYYGQSSGDGLNHYDDPYALNVNRMDSHGGWIATPTDLVRFAAHVDGFDARRNILTPETIKGMTTPWDATHHYARGWMVNERGNWWHGGSLGGTTAILVRTSSHFCWAALTNTRREPSPSAIDDLVWNMVAKVPALHA